MSCAWCWGAVVPTGGDSLRPAAAGHHGSMAMHPGPQPGLVCGGASFSAQAQPAAKVPARHLSRDWRGHGLRCPAPLVQLHIPHRCLLLNGGWGMAAARRRGAGGRRGEQGRAPCAAEGAGGAARTAQQRAWLPHFGGCVHAPALHVAEHAALCPSPPLPRRCCSTACCARSGRRLTTGCRCTWHHPAAARRAGEGRGEETGTGSSGDTTLKRF